MQARTDAELLAKYASTGDEAAFGELVARHGAFVHRVCERLLKDEHEAQDACQTVFLVLARKARGLNGGDLSGWLYRVAHFTASKFVRNRLHRVQREGRYAAGEAAGQEAPMVDESARQAVLDAVDGELLALSARHREAVILRYLRGHSQEEAARLAGCSVTALSVRASRGIETLRRQLAKRGIVAGAAVLVAALESEAHAAASAAFLSSITTAVQAYAATGTASAAVSTNVATLTKGVLHMMFWNNVKMAAVVTAAVMLVGGVGVTTYVTVANAANNAAAPAPATTAAWPLWDGKESVPQYALRAGLVPAAPATAPSVIADLIGKLDSDDFRTREEATRKLGEMGEPARAALERAAGSGNAEVAMRARTALDALDAGEVQLVLDLGNQVTMKLTLIPAGKFLMGSPENEAGRNQTETQYEVTITKPFYMGVCEVTQAQYKAIAGRNPSEFEDPKKPVERVSWNDAVEFCKKLSQKTGRTVRLPTEAQWEWACRAGTQTAFNTGDTISKDQARLDGGGFDRAAPRNIHFAPNRETGTKPAGSFEPNAWGLYDMHGNVFEWCADLFGEYPKEAVKDPAGPANGPGRVARGGSHRDMLEWCRTAFRCPLNPGIRDNCIGFRVCLDLP
jgi:RNA polymerase sigma factor (sigma-70 family)